MGETKKRRGGTLVGQIGNALREAIAGGVYAPGQKLPSEAQLTIDHGVSRTVIREAVAALRADGLVEPRQGAGVFVLEPKAVPALPFQDIDEDRISSILEILELRAPVEIEAAGLAALRRSPLQEETILRCQHEIEAAAREGRATADADFELHLAIAAATNNPRFREFLEMMGRGIIPRATLASESRDESRSVNLDQIGREHAGIVSAILDGEVDAARDAMRAHLKGSQQRYRQLLRETRQHIL